MSIFYRIVCELARQYSAKIGRDAREAYSSQSISGIEIVAPAHYYSCIATTLNALQQADPSLFAFVQTHIDVIYANPHPITFGYVNRSVFILDTWEIKENETLPGDYVWFELAGYLVRMAKLHEQYEQGHLSVILRWSSLKQPANKAEIETQLLLERWKGVAH